MDVERVRVVGVYVAFGERGGLADMEVLLVRQHPDGAVTVACECDESEVTVFAKLIEGTGTNIDIMHRLAEVVRERRERIA